MSIHTYIDRKRHFCNIHIYVYTLGPYASGWYLNDNDEVPEKDHQDIDKKFLSTQLMELESQFKDRIDKGKGFICIYIYIYIYICIFLYIYTYT
jgi:hypothetical protein